MSDTEYMNKSDRVEYARVHDIPDYSKLTSDKLRAWIHKWETYTHDERTAYRIPLKLLKEIAVQDLKLVGVQHCTKKTKMDLVRRIISGK